MAWRQLGASHYLNQCSSGSLTHIGGDGSRNWWHSCCNWWSAVVDCRSSFPAGVVTPINSNTLSLVSDDIELQSVILLISKFYCKIAASPLHVQWRYCRFAVSHQSVILIYYSGMFLMLYFCLFAPQKLFPSECDMSLLIPCNYCALKTSLISPHNFF